MNKEQSLGYMIMSLEMLGCDDEFIIKAIESNLTCMDDYSNSYAENYYNKFITSITGDVFKPL